MKVGMEVERLACFILVDASITLDIQVQTIVGSNSMLQGTRRFGNVTLVAHGDITGNIPGDVPSEHSGTYWYW